MNKTKICEKCGKKFSLENDFYYSNDTNKYSDNHLNICKDCATININSLDPQSYMWILQECDVPYISYEWDKLINRYHGSQLGPRIIIGRYLSKMKLFDFKGYRWKDTSFLNELMKEVT